MTEPMAKTDTINHRWGASRKPFPARKLKVTFFVWDIHEQYARDALECKLRRSITGEPAYFAESKIKDGHLNILVEEA